MSQSCNSNVVLLREKTAEQGTVGEFLVRKILEETDFMEVRYTCSRLNILLGDIATSTQIIILNY